MKHFLLLLFLFTTIFSYSQEVQKVEVLKNDNQITELFESLGKNELKLDIAPLLAFPALDVNYERINDPYSSYGLSLYLNLSIDDSSNVDWIDKFSLTPFYRFYFFNKRDFGGSGFFTEVFSKFSFGKHDVEYYNYNPDVNSPGIDYWETIEENYFDIALGAAIGNKWINKFSLTPFYRFYFFNKRDFGGSGFFTEVFSKFSFGKHDVEYYNYNPDVNSPGIDYWETIEENYFDIALGAAIGNKWINKKGWTFEISLGVGRFLLNPSEDNSTIGREVNSFKPEAVIRGGLSIGKRF